MSGAATARALIESLPLDMPVSEVLEQTKAAGLTIARQTVHAYRHNMRHADDAPTKQPRPHKRTRISAQRLLLESLPDGWTTDQALAAATKAGIALDRKRAHKLRYEIGRVGKVGGGKLPPGVKAKAAAKPKQPTTTRQAKLMPERDRKLHLFKQLILEIGMDAAQEIWDEFAYVRDGAAARRS